VTSFRAALSLRAVAALLAGCGDDSSASSGSEPTATVTDTRSASPTETETETGTRTPTPTPTVAETSTPTPSLATPPVPARGFPCDPGGGFPKPSDTCPYGEPLTGDVAAFDGTTLTLKPFHTYYNDAEGKAYAKKHHLRYPFDDDHYDAPAGPPRTVDVSPDTICTGVIQVGYRDPMKDRKVPCSTYVKAVSRSEVVSALWFDGDHLVQLSELFRP
jgi:hypothetical protein